MLALRSNEGGTVARHGMNQVLDGVSWDSYPPCHASRGTAARHVMYQVLDGVSWDSYSRFTQQLPQNIQVIWLLILYFSEEDFPQMFDGIQVRALSQPPLHQSAQRQHTLSAHYGQGIVLLEDKILPLTIK